MPSPEPIASSAQPALGKPAKLQLVNSTRRPIKLTALEREFLSPLLEIQDTPPSPHQRMVLWVIVGLVVVLIAWACIGKIAIVASAPGKFIPDGRVKEVQPLEAAIVKAIHVREGQHVNPGDILIELDPALSAAAMYASADRYAFNQLEQERLSSELAHGARVHDETERSSDREKLEDHMREAREQAHLTKLAQARATVDEKQSALAVAQATLQKYRETTVIADERESSARPLVEMGAISRIDYLQLKEDLVKNRNDLAAQEKSVDQAQAAVSEAFDAAEQIGRDRVADIYKDLDQQVTNQPELKGDLDKARELYALKSLRSPVSGFVQKVEAVTIGQVVTAAQSLVTIVPEGIPLIVEGTISNQDIGYVKIGQSVEVKVDTFPFQKYGSLKGTLVWISPDAEEKGGASSDAATRSGGNDAKSDKEDDSKAGNNAGYVYKVHIRTKATQFYVDGEATPIMSGMTVQADITTDKRRVIDFFLSPVVKYLDEGLKVR